MKILPRDREALAARGAIVNKEEGPNSLRAVRKNTRRSRLTGAVTALAILQATFAFASDVREEYVRAHMEFLASDALNGRGSATSDERVAATYVAAQLRQYCVEPAGDGGGYMQAVALVKRSILSPPTLSAAEPGASLSSRTWTHGSEVRFVRITRERLAGPLQKIGPGAETPVRKGAVVLVRAAEDRATWRQARQALGSGAVAALVALSRSLPADVEPADLVWLKDLGAEPAPSAMVLLSPAATAAVQALPDGAPINLEAQMTPLQTVSTWNVLGRLTGRSPKEAAQVVLLSAHVDHLGARPSGDGDRIFNGADDDASGVTAVLELARVLSKGKRPKRTLLFAFYGSEESGGFGSRYVLERPPMPLSNVIANVQFEMIGRPDGAVAPGRFWLTGYERSDLGRTLAAHGAPLVADPHPEKDFFKRSDNYGFALRGVVAHTVSSYGLHAEYHHVGDDLSRIDFRHMTTTIAAMERPIRWLLDSRFVPRWAPGHRP